MNAILSIVLALAMMVTSMGGVTARLAEPVTAEFTVQMNQEVLGTMLSESAGDAGVQTLGLIADVLNVLKIRGTADRNTMEFALMAEDEPLFTLGVRGGEDGSATVAGSPLNGKTIFASAEQIKEFTEQMMAQMSQNAAAGGFNPAGLAGSFQTIDKEQFKKDMLKIGAKAVAALSEKVGEPETGEFTVDGMTFTTRTPVNMTFEELAVLVLESAKEFYSAEYIAEITAKFGKEMDVTAKLDEAIEKIKNMPAEDRFTLVLAGYGSNETPEYFAGDIHRDAKVMMAITEDGTEDREVTVRENQDAHFGIGMVDGKYRMLGNGGEPGKMNVTFSLVGDGQGAESTCEVTSNSTTVSVAATGSRDGLDLVMNARDPGNGTPMKFHMNLSGTVSSPRMSLEVIIADLENAVITMNGTVARGGEFFSVFDGEVIPAEELADEDGTVVQTLAMGAVTSLFQAVTALANHLPESSAQMLTQLAAGMMGGGQQQ